jgi:hypothetical protein
MSQQCVRNGLIASLIRPAGNLTGEATLAAELGPKRLELLLELLPSARHIAMLVAFGPDTMPTHRAQNLNKRKGRPQSPLTVEG